MNSIMESGQRLQGDELQHGIRTEIAGGCTPACNQDRDCGEMNSSMESGQRLRGDELSMELEQRLWGDELQHGIRTEIVVG